MSSVPHSEPSSVGSMATVGLRVVLAALAVGCVMGFWYSNSHTDDFRLRYPLFAPWLWNLYLTFYLAGLFALSSIWNWHKWGVWLFVALGVAMLFTEVYVMGFSFSSLRLPVALGGVWFALQPVWQRLR